MFVAALSVSTLTSTVQMFSSAIVEEKNERFRAIEQSLWILTKFKISEIFPRNGGGIFNLVVFDPPHLLRAGETGWLFAKYGRLNDTWKEDLRQGFAECWRCLRNGGTLIFKWNEEQIPISEVLKLAPAKPLLGNRSGKKTHWIVFYKGLGNEF